MSALESWAHGGMMTGHTTHHLLSAVGEVLASLVLRHTDMGLLLGCHASTRRSRPLYSLREASQ
jgi:hypothetical protein